MSYKNNRQLSFISSYDEGMSELEKTHLDKLISELYNLEEYLEYLYSDILNVNDLGFSFKSSIHPNVYDYSNEMAEICVRIKYKCSQLEHHEAMGWITHALLCFDNLIFFYINDCLEETVNKIPKQSLERDNYTHLNEKGDPYNIIGTYFESIYQYRSKLVHPYFIDDNGRKSHKPISKSTKRHYIKLTVELFLKEALGVLLTKYKEHFQITTPTT
ncbi:hypothetical protein [Aureispira anguillae]|uniref:Uncharacterized protein n=1 Tax=Aureispira anguillae TaxID=2864201 RepID=A0A915VKA0_9BACT|nr:hypothetical protein [Aureispira anguillae]BDS09582.1 hypothetical protein AsAng_0002860 [Aureispira anguillae]